MRILPYIAIVNAGFSSPKNAENVVPDKPLSVADFAVPEHEARRLYEEFLLKYPGSNFEIGADRAKQKFQHFHHNLARINYYNHYEQGSAVYGYVE